MEKICENYSVELLHDHMTSLDIMVMLYQSVYMRIICVAQTGTCD